MKGGIKPPRESRYMAAFARLQMRSTTSSIVMSEESTITASSAAFNGEAARDESY